MATINMGLIEPSVGITSGPSWALTLNSNFDLIDSHDHSSGKGATISLNNLAINSDFNMTNFGLSNIKQLQLIDSSSYVPSMLTASKSLFAKGVDLYYYDGSTQIRLTASGSVAGTPGSITNLGTGGSSGTYASNTVTFLAGASLAANVELQYVILHSPSAFGNTITLKAPNLSSSQDIVLPVKPAVLSLVQIDSSGVMNTTTQITTSQITDLNVTTDKLADLSVTAGKIADYTITGSKITSGVNIPGDSSGHRAYVNGMPLVVSDNTGILSNKYGLKIIRGIVNSNGTIAAGSGFTVSHSGGSGTYLINFNSSFYDTPSVTAMAEPGASTVTINYGSTTFSHTTIYTYNNYFGALNDQQFHFIAIGMRNATE